MSEPLRRGGEDLAAGFQEGGEDCFAALFVEFGGHFVEDEDRFSAEVPFDDEGGGQ